MLMFLRKINRRLKIATRVNWPKTLYFNFKKFPFSIAKKLPVFFYGKVRFTDLSGTVKIKGKIKTAMIGFGQNFEFPSISISTSELKLEGNLVFEDYAHIGKDFSIYIGKNGHCKFGYMACLGSRIKLICKKQIKLGDWTGIGYESQIIDTNSHPMKNSQTGEYYPIENPIILGAYNSISNRVSIMPGCVTSNFVVIASNTVCNKNYLSLGEKILIGGIPAKLLKENYIRDWENEKDLLKKNKVVNF